MFPTVVQMGFLTVALGAVAYGQVELRQSKSSPMDYAGGRAMPRYENGFSMCYLPTIGSIWLFNENGSMIRDISFQLPDAALTSISGTAASREGKVVAAVTAYSEDGRMVDGLAWFGAQGSGLEKFVRTTPFAIRDVSFAEDGTLWAFGDVYDDTLSHSPVGAYDVLWHFNAEGKKIGSILSSSLFSTPDQVASRAKFVVVHNKIGVFFELSSEWLETSFSGEVLGRWTIPAPTGLTWSRRCLLTGNDELIFQQMEAPQNGKEAVLRTYAFNKQSAKLHEIDIAPVGGTHQVLMGANGDTLVWRASNAGKYDLILTKISRR